MGMDSTLTSYIYEYLDESELISRRSRVNLMHRTVYMFFLKKKQKNTHICNITNILNFTITIPPRCSHAFPII